MKRILATLSLMPCVVFGIAQASDIVYSSWPYCFDNPMGRDVGDLGTLPFLSFGQVVQLEGESRLLDRVKLWRFYHSPGSFKFSASIYKEPDNVFLFDPTCVLPIWTKTITKTFTKKGVDWIEFEGSKVEVPETFLIIFSFEEIAHPDQLIHGGVFGFSRMPRRVNNRMNVGFSPNFHVYVRMPNPNDAFITSCEQGDDPNYTAITIWASPIEAKAKIEEKKVQDDQNSKINP